MSNDKQVSLVFGINGQDGAHLARLLTDDGEMVTGVHRRSSSKNHWRLDGVDSSLLTLVEGDITDPVSVGKIVKDAQALCQRGVKLHVYNLAAQSHVGTSFKQPDYTFQANAMGPLYILEAIREYAPDARFYQASTSEMFGKNVSHYPEYRMTRATDTEEVQCEQIGNVAIQDETTPYAPQSPYAIAKVAAHNTVALYRDAYNIHASCGILFNHEGELRGEEFVTRKVTLYVADIINEYCECEEGKNGEPVYTINDVVSTSDTTISINGNETEKLHLGNLEACRDWGYAGDYVKGMRLMLQQDKPDDYVLATGITHTIADMVKSAFSCIVHADGTPCDWQAFIYQDPAFYRPAEVDFLKGEANKARTILGWSTTIGMASMVRFMVECDVQRCQNERGNS